MNIETNVTRRFVAQTRNAPDRGGIRITMTVHGEDDDAELPEVVSLEFCDKEGDVNRVEVPPGVLERAAVMMLDLRRKAVSDYRSMVCADHGPYSGTCRWCESGEDAAEVQPAPAEPTPVLATEPLPVPPAAPEPTTAAADDIGF